MADNVIKFTPKNLNADYCCPDCGGMQWQIKLLELSEGDGAAAALLLCSTKLCEFSQLTVIDLGLDQPEDE